MNPQIKEILYCHGIEVEMSCEPLDQYFTQMESPPQFIAKYLTIRRGYLGKWVILNNKLYLTEFIGVLENKDEIALEDLFPGKLTVFAEWFSGEILLEQENLLALNSSINSEFYQKDLHLNFIKGRLINTYLVENELDFIFGSNDDKPFRCSQEK